ncbi:MAG: hypothetical protein AVDCRST_MAG75-1951 [uncultured Propionibacteriaceae bacterium]|uniref:Uncharacterized protein n=1 Tax=uncultured Propionibacteriaceae bacterium TaxID=257457 RepID=A0A6J4NUY9_9ACTN|nr:MAG: hypothetical protein AVDCRST_MAG75-1951 [uncultured Propionibacteriaceae bacterium]
MDDHIAGWARRTDAATGLSVLEQGVLMLPLCCSFTASLTQPTPGLRSPALG